MWIVEGGMDGDGDDDNDDADEDDDEDDNINNEDDNKIIKEDIHDYKPWFKNDVALRFICDLEYGMRKAYDEDDEDDKDKIEDEKPKINKTKNPNRP